MLSCSALTVIALVVMAFFFGNAESFSKEAFCAARCSYGRGGNLCRCNAFHFAGKRADIGDSNVQGLSRDPVVADWESRGQNQESFPLYSSEKSNEDEVLKLAENPRDLQNVLDKIFPQRYRTVETTNEVRRRRNTKLRRQLGLPVQ